jgi:peptidase E
MAKRNKVPKSERHILAMGGGVTSPAMIEYALKLSGKKKPKLLFINTATGDRPDVQKFCDRKVKKLACEVSHLTFFARTPVDLESLILSQDVVFVGGGNTKSMLAVWREYGLDKILHDAWKHGVVMAGSSAGGICWFDGCCTDSWDESFTALPALGILKGSCCPHYDGEAGRQETYRHLIATGELDNGYAIDESAGIHFVGKKLFKVITPKKGATAYRVELKHGEMVEKPLPASKV